MLTASQFKSIALAPEPMIAAAAAAALQPDDGTDTDDDGLTDYVELRIGTSEIYSDTDGDLLSDSGGGQRL